MNKRTVIIGGSVILVAVVVWFAFMRTPRMEAPTTETRQMAPQAFVVTLDPQNNSGEMGTATLTDVGGKTQVVLQLTGAPQGVSQPAHIHTGTCANIGSVVYPLTFPINGSSVTMLDVSIDSLFGAMPLAINVHKSPQEAGVYYACGDISR